MLSVQQSYARLFRPWDASDGTKQQDCDKTKPVAEQVKKRKLDEKRENRLRKIRGTFKKAENVHQDATVSTTTEDDVRKPSTDVETISSSLQSPVTSLTQCCDRLLDPESQQKTEDMKPPADIRFDTHIGQYPAYPTDYFPTDIAHALGVPPSDPLLLESLAQGYAMELEYARIMQQETEAKLLNARKQRPKKYKCPHCQVGFSNNGQLKGHIRIHTGERPFKCEEKNCGKTFTRNEELTRHKRIHSGIRPYACTTCGKKFGRRDHLKKHTRTHFIQAERMMPVFVPLSAMPHGFPYLYGY